MTESKVKDKWAHKIEVREFMLDSKDYHLLENAAFMIHDVEGMSLEIGTRAGGSSRIMIDGIVKSIPYQTRTHICIDPYGGIDYNYTDGVYVEDAYPNVYRDIAIPALFKYCMDKPINFIYFQLTDEQFMKRFADGVPIYLNNKETIETKYALVFFDGPHTTEQVLKETEFFEKRAPIGAMFVYDDVYHFYDHSIIEKYLIEKGWVVFGKTEAKAVYTKGDGMILDYTNVEEEFE